MPAPLTAPMLATGNSLLAPDDKAPFFHSKAAANFSTVMAETTEKARPFMFSQKSEGISPVKVKPKAMPKK